MWNNFILILNLPDTMMNPIWTLITVFVLLILDSHAGLQCDFESNCSWEFDPPSKNGGFRVISGKEKGGKSGDYKNINYIIVSLEFFETIINCSTGSSSTAFTNALTLGCVSSLNNLTTNESAAATKLDRD